MITRRFPHVVRLRAPSKMQAKREALRDAAMPAVKALVKEHGIATVAACLNRIREYGKEQKKLADLKAEVEALEKRL